MFVYNFILDLKFFDNRLKDYICQYFKEYKLDVINNEEASNLLESLYSKIKIFNKETNLEGKDSLNKEKIEIIINKLDDYYNINILNRLNFDQRVLLYFYQNDNNSPKIKNNFLNNDKVINKTINYPTTCIRELFKEEKETQQTRKVSFNLCCIKKRYFKCKKNSKKN